LTADLATEFQQVDAEYRSDQAVDDDLNSMKGVSSEDILAKYDKKHASSSTMALFNDK